MTVVTAALIMALVPFVAVANGSWTTTSITANAYNDMFPQIDGGQVVWEGYDGNDYEIFLAVYEAGEPTPIEVGGTVYPVDKLTVLAPWIVLVAALLVGTSIVVRRRRARS